MSVGDDCLFEAIRKHPYQAMLYVNKISFDVHARRDPMSSFHRAADLAPHSHRVYQTAFNYARPQWGGSLEDLREIYSVAKSNNPGADWPRTLRNEMAPEAKPFIDLDNPWILGGLGTAAGLLLIVAAGWAWSARWG